MKPLSIYIHVPFCSKKCEYCDFYKTTDFSEKQIQKFVNSLVQEIEFLPTMLEKQYSFQIKNRPLHSLFIGGGTPSLLDAKFYEKIFTALKNQFQWNPHMEVTMESNPENLNQSYLNELFDTGINRISLGIQGTQNEILQHLGRKGNFTSIQKACESIRGSKINNFSFDLIFGSPKQTWKEVQEDLNFCLDFQPPHLSIYNLTVGKKFSKYSLLPSEEVQSDLYLKIHEKLEKDHYHHYEISNYAYSDGEKDRSKNKSQHNLVYWNLQDFLGFGPSACGYLNHEGTGLHINNKPSLELYMREIDKKWESQHFTSELSTPTQNIFEFFMMNLRLFEGINEESFFQRYQKTFDEILPQTLDKYISMGYLERNSQKINITLSGSLFLNSILEDLSNEIH